MREPNFFIVGAPKCGTTALYTYLSTHPRVGLSADKEPHYFCEDLPGFRWTKSRDRYRAQFEHVREDALAVGEASPLYLYSEVAASRIRDELPSAKLIVMVRPHVEYLRSYHNQVYVNRDEDQADFASAWELQELRGRGKRLPRTCREPRLLQYRAVGALGAQVERLLGTFPREQVKVIGFDDFTRDTRRTYVEVLDFLGLPDDGRAEFPRVHEAKSIRSPLVANLVSRPPRAFDALRRVKVALGIKSSVLGALRDWNLYRRPAAAIGPAMIARLNDEFATDGRLLRDVRG